MRGALVAALLRGGRLVSDDTFDEIYPEPIRRASSAHWTPLRVCKRVVELLGVQPGERLLDVGSGPGKFCIAAAAMSGARVRGVERQPRLVEVAREAARRLEVQVDFREGTFIDEDPKVYDAAYFFNPFTETILLPGMQEFAADRNAGRSGADVTAAEIFLGSAPPGFRVATFCGFGGRVPPEYERVTQETWEGGVLESWLKRPQAQAPTEPRRAPGASQTGGRTRD